MIKQCSAVLILICLTQDKLIGSQVTEIKTQAVKPSELLFVAACWGDNVDAVKEALGKGAQVDTQTEGFGETVLMRAAGSAKPKVVDYLISQGADINKKDKNGWTPLMHAANYPSNYTKENAKKVILLLLKAGAHINPQSYDDKTIQNNYEGLQLWGKPISYFKTHFANKTFLSILQEKHPELLADADIKIALEEHEKRRVAYAKTASQKIQEGICEAGRYVPIDLTNIVTDYYVDEAPTEQEKQ